MLLPIEQLPNDVFFSAFSDLNYGKASSAFEMVRDALYESLAFSPLSKLIGRTVLNNRFPIFGKEGHLYTKSMIGYNYPKKRVTIPTFDIAVAPDIPEHITWDPQKLQDMFRESLEAVGRTELEYFHGLLDTLSSYNPMYPRIKSSWKDVSFDLFSWAMRPMRDLGIRPVAMFTNSALAAKTNVLAANLGLELFSSPKWPACFDIFGVSEDPELASAILVDNYVKFESKKKANRVRIKFAESVGFLASQSSSLRITLDDPTVFEEKHSPEPLRRIKAFVIGSDDEKNEGIVSIVEPPPDPKFTPKPEIVDEFGCVLV